MRSHFLTALLVSLPILSGGRALAQTPTPTPASFASDQRPLLVPPEPVADPEDADAMVYNPAGAAAKGGEVEYLHADKADPSTLGNGDALYIAGGRIDFAVEAARPAPGVRETLFTIAKAFPFDRYSLGFGYSTTFGRLASNTPADVFTAGFLARPASFLSLGGAIWDLFPQARPVGLDLTTRYGLGAALRPLPGSLNDRLTLAADWAKTDGEQGQDWRLSARLAPVEGVSLYATTLVQGNGLAGLSATRFTAGLTFSLTHAGAGTHGYWDDNGKYAGSSVIVRTRELRQPTLVHLRPEMARVEIGGALPDESVGTLFKPAEETLPDLIYTLRAIRRDPTISGVIVKIKPFGGGLARAEELRDSLSALVEARKKVLCWAEELDTRSYYVASACQRIALHPRGMVEISGLHGGFGFVKGTLDKLGIQVEYARVGAYKSAVEPLTRTEPSREMTEVEEALLDADYKLIAEGIARGRGLEPGQVKALVDGGFYPGEEALKAKLVDYLVYPDELEEKTEDYLGRHSSIAHYGAIAPAPRSWAPPPRIGVIYASGDITRGESRSTPLTDETIAGSDSLVDDLKAAASDRRIRAVVLRVDSPGGDGFASDLIWHEVERLKKKKPVVVSMSDLAASGGYYISMGADSIVAEPATVTGSIGVFALRPNLAGLYSKIDYRKYPFQRGAMAGLFDESRPMTGPEKDTLQGLIDVFYRQFITSAAAGRKTTPESIDAIGRGHVWVGSKARELGLVDELGGLEVAVDRAKVLAHLAGRDVQRVSPSHGGLRSMLHPEEEVQEMVSALPFADTLALLETARLMGTGPAPWLPGFRLPSPPLSPETAERRNPWWPF